MFLCFLTWIDWFGVVLVKIWLFFNFFSLFNNIYSIFSVCCFDFHCFDVCCVKAYKIFASRNCPEGNFRFFLWSVWGLCKATTFKCVSKSNLFETQNIVSVKFTVEKRAKIGWKLSKVQDKNQKCLEITKSSENLKNFADICG